MLRNLLLKVKDAAKNVVSIISLTNFLQEYYHNIKVSSGGAVERGALWGFTCTYIGYVVRCTFPPCIKTLKKGRFQKEIA